ncbi:SprT-like family protein [Corynebacterium massiliense DSM 45435]|uniref:SprT-like family protein n=1 Tax=Corynebacterium massiliense DSM 45435 TaxID=1121364 RepID=A0ABY7U8G4_9CORY|nr:SprT-like family protein [Corynebacterium massiliense DSM 45435]
MASGEETISSHADRNDRAGDTPQLDVRVIRSRRRRKSVQGRIVDGVLEVRIPAWMNKRQEADAVADMLARAEKKHTSSARSDADLAARAAVLNEKYLEGRAKVGSIRWVANQGTRWGSCTVGTGDIRLSDRLKRVPDYVVDSVIVHELVHTFVGGAGHGAEFWRWADTVPLAERAKGYIEAYQRFG